VRVLSPPAKREAAGATPKSAVIIGAYGGDHIGDAAILGGVLLKLHAELGIETAHVMSHRPEHTRRLAAGLSTPVAVKVWRYTTKAADRLLRKASALVIAGGPVMDLPRVLAKHLAVAETAHGLGVPFYIDRVGVGPFRRKLSRWAARRLLEKADRISLRTAGSAKDPAMAGLAYDLHPDPAFEYLKTRAELDRLAPAAVEAVDRLLAGTQGRTLIGLNVRPIEHWWLPDGQDYSRAAEVHFLEQLAEGMVRLSEAAGGEVTFVFFPMNSIQFAMSDLPTGYDLHKLVGDRADLRVWEADPDVDDMLHLLRRLDGALTMRFHASIFALAQGLPTYGVDYYPGQGGKVAELFTDLGREADVRVMDAFDAGWFVEKFSQHLSPRG
jgi:polysaccharide pyruvyl transferase WcaK-like protein